MKHIVQFSGGKDSTAMLLMMLERGMPVDEIVFCDTGKEFPQMYEHIKKVEEYIGRKITILKPEKSFDYYFAEHVRGRGKSVGAKGYGWASMRIRWCTGLLKTQPNKKYLSGKGEHRLYIGIAFDEPKRHENIPQNVIHPLYDWGITEAEALKYCYEHGFDWGGYISSLTELAVGAVHYNVLANCERYENIILSYGKTLLTWIAG